MNDWLSISIYNESIIIFLKELKVLTVYFSKDCFDIKANLPVNKVYKY